MKFNYAYEEKVYDFELPTRSTKGSAGYDIHSPVAFTLKPKETIKVDLKINIKLNKGYFLALYPRSSIGTKYKVTPDNLIGIIDEDFYPNSISLQLTNNGDKNWEVNVNDRICQGIIQRYYLVENDEVKEKRVGGLGSTGV